MVWVRDVVNYYERGLSCLFMEAMGITESESHGVDF